MAPASLPKRDKIAIWSGLVGVSALAWVYLVWMAVMMVGMMVPTAVPMTLIYAAVARKASGQGATVGPAMIFVSGYVAMLTLFSVGALCSGGEGAAFGRKGRTRRRGPDGRSGTRDADAVVTGLRA